MHIAATLPASDLERAKAWYAKVLKLEPVETGEDKSLWYQLDGTRLLLYEATVAELKSRGAVFEDYDFDEDFHTVDGILTSPSGRKMAWFKDSEGNILGLATD
jgi:catechol 2,3-dioxygenase-like lactoylglutathione lyase family enzyme